jgi:hypothetical protein
LERVSSLAEESLDPITAAVSELFNDGHQAVQATYVVSDSQVFCGLTVDDDVTVRATVLANDGKTTEEVRPFADLVAQYAASPEKLADLHPVGDGARVNAYAKVVSQGRLYVGTIYDWRGLPVALASRVRAPISLADPARTREIGPRVANRLLRTTIPAAQLRLERAHERIGADIHAIAASALVEFQVRDPLCFWQIVDCTESQPVVIARGQDAKVINKVQSRLQRAIEDDAFGIGIHSIRARQTVVSGDQPAADDSTISIFDTIADSTDEPERVLFAASAVEDKPSARFRRLREQASLDERAVIAAYEQHPNLSRAELAREKAWNSIDLAAVLKQLNRKYEKLRKANKLR